MKATICVYLCVGFSIYACKTKENSHQNSQLEGKWTLSYGEFNGKEAPSLDKIYFEFFKDSMKTNFTLSEQEESGTFLLANDKLIQKTAESIEYQIIQVGDSTLEMTTELRGYDFKLALHRQ